MKWSVKFLFFALIFLCFSHASVIAQSYSCPDDQTIMKLTDRSNAHASSWTGSNYATEICYNEVFGLNYGGPRSGTSSVHDCVGGNGIVNLSGTINAHGQILEGTASGYSYGVCFGDLVCNSVDGGVSCGPNQAEVVSLSSGTNAHLGVAGSYANSANGNKKICCSSASSQPAIVGAKWRYINGQEISSNALICPNIYLAAHVRTFGMSNGAEIKMIIYEDDTVDDDVIAPEFGVSVMNNEAIFILNLTDSGIRSYLNSFFSEPLEGSELELYFEARSSLVSGVEKSQIIRYTDNETTCNYPKPIASITAPKHQGVYFANTEVNFSSGCSSLMGPVRNEWTITQGSNSFTDNRAEFLHTFNNNGQANVKLKCTDLSGKVDLKEVQILVVEANRQVLAYIEKPALNEFVTNPIPLSGPYFPESVRFAAADSYVVNVTSPCNVFCLGGTCPTQTQNSLGSCGAQGGPITITNAPTSPLNANYSNMTFDWTFKDNDWINHWSSFEGEGVYTGVVLYDDMSNTINDKYMSVMVTHTNTGSNALFEREFTLGRCLNNRNTYYEPSVGPLSTLEKNGACRGGDGEIGTLDDCCPSAHRCLTQTGGASYTASCQIPSGNIVLKCEDFTDSSSCNGNNDTSIHLASYGGRPPVCTNLKCFWDNSTDSCGLKITTYNQTSQGCDNGRIINNCEYTTSSSECINGRKTISYNPVAGSSPSCRRDPVIAPCGALSFELDFFGIREFIISLLLIASIYLLINFYKVNK